MTGEISVWAYPWDLHDIGLDDALAAITQRGANMVSLATSYHAGRFLQPGNPRRRVYVPQDGTVYFTLDPARWAGAEIAPLQADIVASEGDYLAELIARRAAGGPKVSCWNVCLHNTRLGMEHPDHVTRNALGDRNVYALCPSSPASRTYVTGMVAEISERYRPDRIELESPDFMGFDHGFHHEKDGLGLLDEDRFLLGLCFCDHCRLRATRAGVDAEAAQRIVADILQAAFARALPVAQFPEFAAQGQNVFADVPALADFLRWRSEPVTSLIAEIRATAHPDTRILLIDMKDSWWGGVDLQTAATQCDGVLYCIYSVPSAQVGPVLQAARKTIGPDKALIAGFQLFHPEIADCADLVARTRAAAPHVNGLNYYNLGLVPAARLAWIEQAVSALR